MKANGSKDGATVRKERLHTLLKLIESMSPSDENKIKGIFMLNTGLTLQKIGEYIHDLEVTGLIERKEGRITIVKI